VSPGDLAFGAWCGLVVAAALVGVAKTAVSGVGSVAVVIFAIVLPARESTGAILPLLVCGDIVAVSYYRRHADGATLWRLIPGVLPGLVLGALFLAVADDNLVRRTIGGILLVMTALQLWQQASRRPAPPPSGGLHGATTLGMGATAGFTTMTANAAGPVTTIYLIRTGLPKLSMIGTGAWFYLAVNLAKMPFSAGLSLIRPGSLAIDALLVPALLVGAVVGILVVRRLEQRQFELVALAFSAAAAALLLLV
jgi:uncharacterized protein